MTTKERPAAFDVFDAACPSRSVFGDATGRWGALTLAGLAGSDSVRFAELRRRVGGISDRMLAQTLQQLETDGLIEREVRSEIPPWVEYRLTGAGLAIATKLVELIDALYEQLPVIMEHRHRA